MQTEVELIRCPNCGHELGHTARHDGFKAGATSIGPPLLRCPSCGILVDTEQKEWDQHTTIQKAWFMLSRVLWLAFASFFICGGTAEIIKAIALWQEWVYPSGVTTLWFASYGVCTLLLAALFIRNAVAEIRTSLNRSDSEEARSMWREANALQPFDDSSARSTDG